MEGGECKEAGKGSLARKVKRGGVRGGEQLLTSVRTRKVTQASGERGVQRCRSS